MASYRSPAAETRGFSFRRDTNNQHIPSVRDESRSNTEQKVSISSKETGIRAAMPNDRLSNVTEGHTRNQTRPSALPRSTSSSSQARLSYIASTRPMPSFAGKSPPLQAMRLAPNAANSLHIDTSGSSITQKARQDSFKQTVSPLDMDEDTVLGIVMPEKPSTYPPATLPPRLIPELQALAASTHGPLNVPSSSISTISSPSTQFTASSSPWSASTAATTPISWSSASPSVVQTAHGSSKRSHTVPMPANLRTKIPKMPTLKETNASVPASKAPLASESERTGRKLRRNNNPDLNPPPRSSSLKGNRSRSNSATTTKSDKQSAPEISIPKFPVPPMSSSAPTLQVDTQSEPAGRRQNPQISQGHTRLQEALNTAERPRGPRTAVYEPSAQDLPNEYASPRPRQLLEPLPVVQSHHRRLPSLSRRHHRQASISEPESEKQSARSRLAKFSKFALFGRSKNSAEPEQKPQKLLSRKGPAAGTGHEGYGKFGRRLRKHSVSSSIAATDSETSLASVSRRPTERRQSRISSISQEQSDLDEFAAPRLKPRVMMGGSQRGQVDSFQLMSKNRQMSDVSLSTMSSADSFPAYTRLASPRRERFPPEDEDTPPTLITRRSQRLANGDEPFSFPEPIETQSLATTPCLDSRNTTQSSDLPTPASAMYKIDPNLLEKQRNKSKRLKWNIFRRKDSMSDVEKPAIRASSRAGVSVDVTPGPMHRPVPYYAMLGSDSEVNTTASIGQYLREAAESPEKENEQEEMISVGFSDNEIMENPYLNRESILLPSAPIREHRQPQTTISYDTHISGYGSSSQNEAPEDSAPGRKQPRLAQVGRIPKVVSTRQPPQPAIPIQQQVRTHTRERLRRQASSERLPRLGPGDQPQGPSHLWSNLSRPEVEPGVQSPASQRRPMTGGREFLRYVEVRNSDFTTSSESTGIISIAGPPLSHVPSLSKQPVDHFSHEDDVWNEYDDFMDDIMSPASSIKSPPKQKKDKPAAAGRRELRQQNSGKDVAKAKGLAITPAALHGTSSSKQFLSAPSLAPSNVAAPSELEAASDAEIRLRRSRIAPALHASYVPLSPFSMRDFIDEYGRRGSGKYSERLSGSSAQASTPRLAIAQPQREQSRPRQYEQAAHLEEIERAKDPAKHSDRAYASLMVSRWLSFGRVLFSPAHKEIESNPEKHVLVIDGLGSEDWSIYCAVTYQNERAYVHDLKERRQRKHKAQSAQTVENAPPNHRRSEVSSFNDKFPFPPEFFCAIVIRFPPVMPDSKLKNIVSECRRVLAPGGYLELVVLDLDIVNMGVHARRAIKELKIKLTAADKTVSLKPIIDNVQTVLGSNGFSNVNRCMVCVPVVGKPAGSLDSSSESRSSTGSTGLQERRVSAGPRPHGSLGSQANFSLNDLVADHSENADAKIGKMISKTARSWWQHCFEAGIMMKGGRSKSVFANRDVLTECKGRGASFKLLIAYTQKPTNQQRERSMSEPTVATLVTAGAGASRHQR